MIIKLDIIFIPYLLSLKTKCCAKGNNIGTNV